MTLAIIVIFAGIAAYCAFRMSYEEYDKYVEKKRKEDDDII